MPGSSASRFRLAPICAGTPPARFDTAAGACKECIAGEQDVLAQEAHGAGRVARRLQHGKAKASDLDSVTVGIGVGVIQRPGRQALGQGRVRLAQPDGAARRLRHAAHAADMVKMTVRQQDSADGQAIALRCLQHALWRIAGIDDGADAVVIRSEIAIGLVAAQHQGIDLHGILLFSHRTNA